MTSGTETEPEHLGSAVPGPMQAQVTIIIPAYNYGRYLPRAIGSVMSQTFGNFEVVIVDDGSTDDTAALAASLKKVDRRIRYVHQRNAGLSAARNTGIEKATTPYVVFLDADDELVPTYLERCLATLEALPGDYALVACSSSAIDENGAPLNQKRIQRESSGDIRREDLLLKNRFPCTVLARRSVFGEVGVFDTSLRSSEDRDMWIRVASRHRIFRLNEPLVRIRKHAVNMSSNSEQMRENMRKVLTRALRQDCERTAGPFLRFPVVSYFHFQVAWMLHEEGRPLAALRHMLISLSLWPYFPRRRKLNEPVFFRARGLVRFLFSFPRRRAVYTAA